MSVFNAEHTVEKAVNSILRQSYKNFEFIVIDDGSTDGTLSKLKSYTDKRLLVVKQKNMGLTKSLNKALRLASGELIARQDADDCSYINRFSVQLSEFQNDPNLVLIGSNSRDFFEDGTVTTWGHKTDEQIRKKILLATPFPHSTAMMRKSSLKHAGFYDEALKTSQDLELWMRLSKIGRVTMVEKPLIERFVHKNSISNKKKFRQLYDATRSRLKHRTKSFIFIVLFSAIAFLINLNFFRTLYFRFRR